MQETDAPKHEYKFVDLWEGRRIRYTKSYLLSEAQRLNVTYERLLAMVLWGGMGEVIDDTEQPNTP